MASRESYKISNRWKYPDVPYKYIDYRWKLKELDTMTRTYIRCRSVVKFIYFTMTKSKHTRHMFWVDNFIIPYNKIIGCKLTSHDWFFMGDEDRMFCTKCHKDGGEVTENQFNRMKKMKKIKNKIKKGN